MIRTLPPDVVTEPGDRSGPADSLSDHRGRYVRHRHQLLPHQRLERRKRCRRRRPLVLRRPVRSQHPLDPRPSNEGSWRGVEDVELKTLNWVDWFNTQRFHEALDDLTPMAAEELHYATRN
ncbi:integrase core domain-containing protein [Aeromicrobium wangtongii]|uniref:integrase core domain-containing protein n=1 Tax=Aeromicrobium wangtongii TaxID=2969247 RepID=UPI003F6F9C2C